MQVNNITAKELIEIYFSLIFRHRKGLNFHYKNRSRLNPLIYSLIYSSSIPSILSPLFLLLGNKVQHSHKIKHLSWGDKRKLSLISYFSHFSHPFVHTIVRQPKIANKHIIGTNSSDGDEHISGVNALNPSLQKDKKSNPTWKK